MRDAYASVANPIWEAWGDSYMVCNSLPLDDHTYLVHRNQHEWLVQHGIIKSDYEKKRDALRKLMENYYYEAGDTAWSSWSDSDLREWLVDHNIIKPDAHPRKDKLRKLVQDNYASAADTIYAGWRDSEMRDWLVEHGYLRSDVQVKRDELLKLFTDK
jgi:Putative nuclear envelope organisation protein